MARIAGVNLPTQKRLEIGLTYIYGIGRSTSQKIISELELDPEQKVRDLTDEEVTKLRNYIDSDARGRGRSSPGSRTGDQAADGDRRLPRDPPPPRPPGARPAHEDERAHAQGPEEDRRTRQEGEVGHGTSSQIRGPRPHAAPGPEEHRHRPGAHQDVVQQHDRHADRRARATSSSGSPPARPASRARASRRRSPLRSPRTTPRARAWSTASRRSRSS